MRILVKGKIQALLSSTTTPQRVQSKRPRFISRMLRSILFPLIDTNDPIRSSVHRAIYLQAVQTFRSSLGL